MLPSDVLHNVSTGVIKQSAQHLSDGFCDRGMVYMHVVLIENLAELSATAPPAFAVCHECKVPVPPSPIKYRLRYCKLLY